MAFANPETFALTRIPPKLELDERPASSESPNTLLEADSRRWPPPPANGELVVGPVPRPLDPDAPNSDETTRKFDTLAEWFRLMLGVLLRLESRTSRSAADGGASDGGRGVEGDGNGDADGVLTPRPMVDLALVTVEADT